MHMKNGKELALGVLTVASGVTNAYLWQDAFFAGGFKSATFYSLPVLALFLFAVLFSLSAAFIRAHALRISAAVVSVVAGFVFTPFHAIILPGIALAGIGSWYASGQIANEYAAANYFSVRKTLRSGLPIFFTAVALMFAVFYFSSISALNTSPAETFLPRAFFDFLLPLFEKPLQEALPGFRSDASVDQLILAFAAREFSGGIDPAKIPPAERAGLLGEGRKALSLQLGIELRGDENSVDVLYRAANAQIEEFSGPFRDYLPFLAAFGFFVAVKTFTLPVYWVTLILVGLVVKLLLTTGFLNQRTETIQVTKLTF